MPIDHCQFMDIQRIIVPAKKAPSSKLHHSIQTITIPDMASLKNCPQSNRLSVVQPTNQKIVHVYSSAYYQTHGNSKNEWQAKSS